MQRLAYAALAFGLALGAGCGDHADDRPYDLPYLTATIFQPSCGATQCHSQFAQQNGVVLDTPEHVRESMVRKSLVTFGHDAYDPDAPEESKLNIWLTQIQPGDVGSFRMPLDAPLPSKDLDLIRTWISDPELLPPVCSTDPDPPRELCGAGRGAGAQCDPGRFDGYACDNFDVEQCGPDWNFGDFAHHCRNGCVGIPRDRPGFDDLEKIWCIGVCGDDKVEGPEECDGNPDSDGFACSTSTCTYCGNGVVYGNEECDDHNLDDGDGCSHLCLLECGDKKIEGAEECDDGNRKSGDGCSSTCQKE